ncbi:methionine ABC transporter ATP-binding protein [Parageobacillus thermoglucosidasius]|uniref:methionine ABC transporter ATP-binding protein n=1 Tax=Parageobacillus thermoglucosidasius TaxID=1426 RepID=UPI0001D17806|nr:methionine ABC transporter ATP-binding protein [Parageobacillus thermoglucosidasius]AEH49413.1 Phosphonate-transporting ATPase [Parageobacillus thermoglucosidasius C56-YS93]MED4904551.1 methionine ABC transporter ATP-binding protein [Parageobacillus thermoglucosidasius]MED4913225.1 methionine ABC transporter ATP-binding protein [Parageobacillus thermoglucosidasius]MED4944147.1 methionine ABC transporter ATP-binding protein [Parageobacillus thermoglucosidasius]MED4984716.1 methionine ABC tra
MIEFRNVSKIFKSKTRTVEALKNINLTVEKGDIFGVIGFSGAGKSTLLRMVNLLEKPTSGQIFVDGQDLSKLSEKELRQAKKNIGMIFQHFNLLRSKTVFDNVAMPLKLRKTPKSVIEERVNELLRFVDLSDKANSYPNQLSGGQKQRVGIARALATNPSILLCDEPTSALDPQTTTSILQLLKRVNQEYDVTILIITHEMEVIKQICNRVAVMQNGEIIEEGTILDIFSKPKTETARNFVRSVLKDEIPQSIFNILQSNGKFSKIYNMEFIGESSGKPVLSQVAKSFAVDVNILFGSINELQGVPFGNLIVELRGEEAEIARAYDFIVQQNVLVNEVVRNGS